MVPDPKEGDKNGLSTQGATRCAPRMPNWKMGPTLQGLPSEKLPLPMWKARNGHAYTAKGQVGKLL